MTGGRAAALSHCIFTTGNLLHHAVEMLLKGHLSKTVSLKDLASRKKFGHKLSNSWAAFKGDFPADDLTEFDAMIDALNEFENIRYPDEILAHGVMIGIGFGRSVPVTGISADRPVAERCRRGDSKLRATRLSFGDGRYSQWKIWLSSIDVASNVRPKRKRRLTARMRREVEESRREGGVEPLYAHGRPESERMSG